ncbi:MAG: 2-C-methyl-D-erythritol 4-phosphate cytidylyltransferase [Candidatus Gorgyraea atricola]|nr:2-C-methyl-D-erythritol 4-phosphate cytidylyltransferase [Candidatus Gorgyraea atricola]
MNVAAIVPAAGKGRRIKSKIAKPHIKLCGKPILAHTLVRLSKNKHIKEIIVSVDKKHIARVKRFKIKNVKVVAGGRERKHSVLNALKKVSSNIDYVLIHDGVRPFLTDKLINASLKAARSFGASVVAVPVKPTLKCAGRRGCVAYTPDRTKFWEAQTPQVFKRDLIEKAYRAIGKKNITDDSMLVELLGIKPKLVMGSYRNIKITTEEDLKLAKMLCSLPPL